jgi:hypothetical protein
VKSTSLQEKVKQVAYTQEEIDTITAEEPLATTFTQYWQDVFNQIDQMNSHESYAREASYGVRRVKDLLE